MKTRILTGIIAICLFVPVCYFSYTVAFSVVIGLLCGIGVYEISKCLGFDKKYFISIPMYVIAVGLPIFRYFTGTNTPFLAVSLVTFFGILIYVLTYVMLKKNEINLSSVLTYFALFVYIVGCFSSMVVIRYSQNGKYLYLLAFLGAWVCDTFAYFVGKFFGKHKLIPEISPKKTIEGSIGGIVFTIIAFVLYGLIVNNIFADANLNYGKLCVLGLILPIVSQIGDLIASTVKRQNDLKDYGNLFPGHGGVLDRFDSVMLTAPTLYVLTVFFKLIQW